MAESTLSFTYANLLTEIAAIFPELSGSEDMIIQDGYRQFLYPPEVFEGEGSYGWSFLPPDGSLNTITEYDTGTVEVVNGSTTVTLTTGTWPSWVSSDAMLTISSTEYAVSSRDSDTEITLAAAWAGSSASGLSYSIHYHPEDYDLPDDFGGIVGEQMTIDSTTYRPQIKIVTPELIETMRLGSHTASCPRYAAVRPKAFTEATGQRWQIMFYPRPNDDYTVQYRYNVNPDAITANGNYALGGPMHAYTLKASCLAVAEERNANEKGHRWQTFVGALQGSIRADQRMRPKNLGYCDDLSGVRHEAREWDWGEFSTYNGVDISV